MKVLTGAAFLLLLGAAGGIERGPLALTPGAGLMALALLLFGIGLHEINRKEMKQ